MMAHATLSHPCGDLIKINEPFSCRRLDEYSSQTALSCRLHEFMMSFGSCRLRLRILSAAVELWV